MWNKIGLIGAMVEEIQRIEERLESRTVTDKAGIRFMEGTFCGKPVVLCKSGVGKVNAAVCTQLLIDRFGVDAVVFTGVAGALDPSLDIGDIVISTDCQQHDMDASPLGFPRGTIPFAETSVFPAHPELVRLAVEASERLAEGRTLQGRVLSGDQFVADRETVRLLHERLGGACTEMEGSAVAQVCAMNGVPYVVIRSMSDKADGSAHVNFAEFAVQAADRSYRIVERMIGSM
ncbi:5'-methylthioadenosine/adenosylhomocysteine nucleosidase [Paenibacillus flagellatus]|uniref:adenosylhomocysteine nucleosidase n=1 Tax=Paenibacillus flagellatus TaxID=2211139 RepID=A0A2V5K529_9BACL|nr:5'-methylthioadenosine/adenosylhomocysteine nucleosidase [Paenibacillus flagellatus]PYI54421.1 5'-methylthioadenosine/adenosylhomocysteine nucleosidase [Paenibacillus flagellatus]